MTTALAPLGTRLAQRVAMTITLAADKDAAEGDRTFTALGVPYDEELKRVDWRTGATRQKWADGSIALAANTVLYWRHDHLSGGIPIGRVLSAEQTKQGIKITARLSTTPKADEIYTLMQDDVLTSVSGGLETFAWHLEEDGDLLVHDTSEAWEFSVVDRPAYDSAAITSVNAHTSTTDTKETNPMTQGLVDPSTLASATDLATLSASVNTLERKIDTLPTTLGTATPAAVPFRSYGEFVKAVVLGDTEAINFANYLALSMREQDPATVAKLNTLAYTGGTTGDIGAWLKPTWVGDVIRLVQANRKLHEFFSSAPLPASGMSVEYGKLTGNTLQVAEQVAEGDVLGFGKLSFGTATAPVKTFGGAGELTRQEIERSAVAVVEKFFTFLAIAFAKNSEAALNTLTLLPGSSVPLVGGGVTDITTANGWNTFVLRSARQMEENFGVTPTGLIVGYDVLETLVNLTEANANDKYLTRSNGSINVLSGNGDVQTLKILPISTGATNGFVRVAHPEAIQTFGSPNPTQLTDGDITNLTQAFSVYGYEAMASTAPGLMIAPDGDA